MEHAIFFNTPVESHCLGHIFAEVYKDNVYAPFLNGKKNLTIVDIGANVGVTSYYFSQFAKVVYAIEPSLEHFTLLSHMVDYNKLENVKPVKVAIAATNGSTELIHTPNKTAFTLCQGVRESNPTLSKATSEIVETVTIEKLFNDLKIDHCDFLKLDIEGLEHEVLSGTPFKNISNRVQAILLEVHNWAGRNPHQIIEALRNNGFRVGTINNQADLIFGEKNES